MSTPIRSFELLNAGLEFYEILRKKKVSFELRAELMRILIKLEIEGFENERTNTNAATIRTDDELSE